MNILILEDETTKLEKIKTAVLDVIPNASIVVADNFMAYHTSISTGDFDLILIDLIVPRSKGEEKADHSDLIVSETRHADCLAFSTPAIVLTQYLESSDGALYAKLNKANINAIHFDASNEDWQAALKIKIISSRPNIRFDVVIICALPKEADAYESVIERLEPAEEISGLMCRKFSIEGKKGAIVSCPRMGLVTTAVIAAYALERFTPSVVAMSGICGGIPNESKIYDTLVSDVCHQHDAGKWGDDGFKVEHYDVQVSANVRNALERLIRSEETLTYLKEKISVSRAEYPDTADKLDFKVDFAATSSGSAVLAAAGKTAELTLNQRKLSAFDMEIYSVYEACRLSPFTPKFFAVKSVVDDGAANKGDRFHRIGCLLSAKFVFYALQFGKLF